MSSDLELLPVDTEKKAAKQIRFAAMNLLARREYSFAELLNKLNQRFDEVLVVPCLQCLADEGLQSDQRFTEDYVRSLVNKGKGPFYIRQKLQQKGVAEYIVDLELGNYKGKWLSLANDVYCRKYPHKAVDLNDKAKRYRFLTSRGFSSDIIQELLE